MRSYFKVIVMVSLIIFIFSNCVYAHSIRHHLILMGKSLFKFTLSPLYGIFIKGPRNIKEAYDYEVYGDEKSEKRGLFRKKLFALWRAPGEETKGLIDGLVDSAKAGGQFLKEFISIFFSD